MSYSQSFSNDNSYYNNIEKVDDSSTVFDADTVTPAEVPSLPLASQEESPQSFTSELLRRINSRNCPTVPSTITITTATATATATRSEEMSRSNQHQSSSSSSSKKRTFITNSSSHSSRKKTRRSSRLKRQQPQDQSHVDKSDSEVGNENELEDYEPDEAVINQSSSSQISTKRQRQNELKWKNKFEELRAHKHLHGHTNVPRNNKQLGLWVHSQRTEYKKFQANKKAYITKERIKKLESIGFEWEPSKWNERFTELKLYKEKNDHTNVPRSIKQLGKWVSTQRTEYKNFQENRYSPMTNERIQMLESIGFEWVSSNKGGQRNESAWNKRFNELKDYKEKYGRTNVPNVFKDSKKLGNWVKKQRREYNNLKANKKSQITSERIDLLNSIGFQWECRPGRAPRS